MTPCLVGVHRRRWYDLASGYLSWRVGICERCGKGKMVRDKDTADHWPMPYDLDDHVIFTYGFTEPVYMRAGRARP